LITVIRNVSALVNPALCVGDFKVAGNCIMVNYEQKYITEFCN
jgi:hypothetical protein